METEYNNTVNAVGNYDTVPTSITSNTTVVTMVTGLTISKESDKKVWVDGPLNYTLVLNNDTEKIFGKPVITDILDGNLVDFVDGSVTIDGVKATSSEYIFRSDTNTLTVNLEDLEPSGVRTVRFQVVKKS